jgi:hypothetical protein
VWVLEREGAVRWVAAQVEGGGPEGREHHTMTALSDTRMFVFGGACARAWHMAGRDGPTQAQTHTEVPGRRLDRPDR